MALVMIGACGVTERLFYHPLRGMTPPPRWLHHNAEAFWITASDGTRLRAWFIPAADMDGDIGSVSHSETGSAPRSSSPTLEPGQSTHQPSSRATVIHLHGNAGNMTHHLDFTAHLVTAGFNLVLVDYRGYGESEGSARRRDDLIDDARSTLRAVAARADVDPSRVGVFGHSLGGAVAMSAIDSLNPGTAPETGSTQVRVRALVLESPFASWREVAASALGGDPPVAPARWLAALLIPDGARPLDVAHRLTMPVLVVHGDEDRIVPISHGRRIAEAIPNATFAPMQGGGHNTLMESHPWMPAIVAEFFRDHLAPVTSGGGGG